LSGSAIFDVRDKKTMNVLFRKMMCFLSMLLAIVAVASNYSSGRDGDTNINGSKNTIASSANVVVDGSIEYQTIDGWGITHYITKSFEGPNRYPISEKDVMLQIKNDICIDFVYVYYHDLYETKNDNDDPFRYNWDSYNNQFGNNAIVFERMKEIQNLGLIIVDMGGYGKPSWMVNANGDFDSSLPNVFDEFAEYWSAFMLHAKKNYGLRIPYLVVQAEPSYHVGPNFTPQEYARAIRVIGARLRKEGFNTMILAPEDANAGATEDMCQTLLIDPSVKDYISNITFHGYDGVSQVKGPDAAIPAMTSLAENSIVKYSGLSLWMTEWAIFYDKRMRDYVDSLRLALDFTKMVYNTHVYANASNFVIWSTTYDWGYDVDNNGKIEKEGIFGPGLTNGKLNLKKYGHALSQYTKYIPPGSKRINAIISYASNVFVTAYRDSTSGTFSFVFINKNPNPVSLNINIKNIPGLKNLRVIRTSATENSAELGTIALNDSSFTTALRDLSVTTFTGNVKFH
jgi:glucuronoarabinoxylan endo-1,4-beta-xylanase